MFVLERLSGTDFRRVGTAPEWLIDLYPESAEDTALISPSQRFPFIAHFLEEAEVFWQSGVDGALRSPNWIETPPQGSDHYLDALALNVGPTRLLIINLIGIGTTERQTILQQSREKELQYHRELAASRKKTQ